MELEEMVVEDGDESVGETISTFYCPLLSVMSGENTSSVRKETELSHLVVSGQNLTRIDSLAAHRNVKKITASNNELCRLSCFTSVKSHLEYLDLENNRIHFLDGLNALTKLQWLNLAQNRIERVPVLDKLTVLRHLNLSSNSLVSIPNIACLQSLQTLILSNNHIESLDLTRKYFPLSLAVLFLDGNKIRDLCQVSYLFVLKGLEDLCLARNPCVSTVNLVVDCRPYFLCCCPQLKVIDGLAVTESEQLKGEWLYSQGKGRQFLPGNHDALCSYLAKICPLQSTLVSESNTEFEERIQRVLEKKHEHDSTFENSIPVAYSQLMADDKQAGQHQRSTYTLGGERASDPPEWAIVFSASWSPFLCQDTKSLQLSPNSQKQFSGKPAVSYSLPTSCRRNSTDDRKSKRLSLKGSKSKTPLDCLRNAENSYSDKRQLFFYSEKQIGAAIRLQSWWRGIRTRKSWPVQKLFREIRLARVEYWIRGGLETSDGIIRELSRVKEVNSALSNFNEQLLAEVRRIEREQIQDRVGFEDEIRSLRNRCENLEQFISFCLPVPTQLQFETKTNNSGVLSWELAARQNISGYHLYVDGQHCGSVSARNCKAYISDLDPTISHSVRIKCFSERGFYSSLSEELHIAEMNRPSGTWPYFESSVMDFDELKKSELKRDEILWLHFSEKQQQAKIRKSFSSHNETNKISSVASRLKAAQFSVEI